MERSCRSCSVLSMYWSLHFVQVTQWIMLCDLHAMCCLMLNTCPVDVMLMVDPNVAFLVRWQSLHRLSLHLWKPASFCCCWLAFFLCVSAMCPIFPFPLANVRLQISQMLDVLSMVLVTLLATCVSGGSRLLTIMSFKLRLRRYAMMGGSWTTSLHLSLAWRIGSSAFSCSLMLGNIGLYVVENMTRFWFCCWCDGVRASVRVTREALLMLSLIRPILYPRLRNLVASWSQWSLKSVVLEQMRRILRANAYGRFAFWW